MEQTKSTSSRVAEWIAETFPQANLQKIGIDDSLFESGIVDSLGTLEIVQFLETEFNVQITDEEMVADHFETINSIAQLVDSKQG